MHANKLVKEEKEEREKIIYKKRKKMAELVLFLPVVCKPGRVPHQKTLLALDLRISSLQNCEK